MAKHDWDTGHIELLHLDAHIAAINKPSGMFTHAGFGISGVDAASLTARVLEREENLHTVHRIDRGTSGVLLFARHPDAARHLHACFAERRVTKQYLALAWGEPPEEIHVEQPLTTRGAEAPVPARTRIRTLHTCRGVQVGVVSLVEAWPEHGRYHQIRRHLAGLGHPIVGDSRYGRRHASRVQRRWLRVPRLALHAQRLTFPHPEDGAPCTITAPLHDDLQGALKRMGAALS